MTKITGSGSVSQRYGSADPDPYQKCHGSATLINSVFCSVAVRVRDILVPYESGSADPCRCLSFSAYTFEGTVTAFFKDKKQCCGTVTSFYGSGSTFEKLWFRF
jgi:hypothetical protein